MANLLDLLQSGLSPITSPTETPDFGIQTPNFTYEDAQNRVRDSRHSLRGILATLGDAISVGAGGDPYYQQKQDRNLMSAALSGFDANPDQAIADVARVNPQMAQQLIQMKSMDDYRRAVLPIRQQSADARELTAQANAAPKVLGSIARLIKTADPSTWDNTKATAEAILAKNGIPMTLPDKYDPQAISDLAFNMSTPDYQQRLLAQGDKKIVETGRHNLATEGIGQQNADANTTKAGASVMSAGAAQTRAGAAVQQANTSASIAPSTINRNNAQADRARRNSLIPPSAQTSSPLAKYEGKIVSQNGHRYKITNGKPVLVN